MRVEKSWEKKEERDGERENGKRVERRLRRVTGLFLVTHSTPTLTQSRASLFTSQSSVQAESAILIMGNKASLMLQDEEIAAIQDETGCK